jgi:hypothetical protein
MESLLQKQDRRRATRLAASLLVLAAGWSQAGESPSWRVVRGDVRVTCPMTVGGSFEAKTTALTGTLALAATSPATFSGELSVDLVTLDTGIGLRNEHLREHYLQVGQGDAFKRAVLSEISLGNVDPASFQGKTRFTGIFLLHGTKKAIAGQATVRREGPRVRVDATFPVLISDYSIPKPQYLGVGVTNEVSVAVTIVAEPAAGVEVTQ